MINSLSPREAKEFLDANPNAKLVDVRTDEEYEIARIPGSILANNADRVKALLELPRDTPLVMQCHHGIRSLSASNFFINHGFTNVFNLTGGIDAWSDDVDPTIPKY